MACQNQTQFRADQRFAFHLLAGPDFHAYLIVVAEKLILQPLCEAKE